MRPLRLSKQVIWGDIWQLPPRLKCLKHVMQDRQEKHDWHLNLTLQDTCLGQLSQCLQCLHFCPCCAHTWTTFVCWKEFGKEKGVKSKATLFQWCCILPQPLVFHILHLKQAWKRGEPVIRGEMGVKTGQILIWWPSLQHPKEYGETGTSVHRPFSLLILSKENAI